MTATSVNSGHLESPGAKKGHMHCLEGHMGAHSI